jgi:glycosyltransferase involved in cell wall biosynthesis
MSELKTIAVDLVPVLPGADNGGAKIFTLELIRTLAALKPQTQFVLLTQATSHDELAFLDSANVSRRLIWGAKEAFLPRQWLSAAAKAVMRVLPRSLGTRVLDRVRRMHTRRTGSSLLREIGADLLFCPFTAPLFYDLDVPTVCVVYDLQYKSYPQFFSAEETLQRERTFKDASRCASALAVISDYVRSSVVQTGAIDPARVFTVHIRLPHRLADVNSARTGETLRRFGLHRGAYLFYPANFWRHKNHEMLLTAFLMARAAALPPHIKVVLTGALSERMKELAAAADALGLKDCVVFAGFLPETDFAALLKNCLAVVFPSLYEGFGMPVIEAMAAGCPVACSDRTSLPEVASEAALLFDPRIPSQIADALVRIATDEKLRASLIARGRLRAAFFGDSKQMADEYWSIFTNVIMNARAEMSLQGIHDDGWSGPAILLRYTKDRSERSVDIELHAPEWLPSKRFEATIRNDSGHLMTRHTIAAGQSQIFQIPIGPESGKLDIQITPSFRPSDVFGSDDRRQLALIVRKLQVRGGDRTVTLFPTTA